MRSVLAILTVPFVVVWSLPADSALSDDKPRALASQTARAAVANKEKSPFREQRWDSRVELDKIDTRFHRRHLRRSHNSSFQRVIIQS